MERVGLREKCFLCIGGGAEALGGASFGFGGFVFAVSGCSCGFERAEQAHGSGGDFVDGGVERFFVGLRWLIEAADFPDELERSGAHFLGSNGRIEIKQWFDVSAHRLPAWDTCLINPK